MSYRVIKALIKTRTPVHTGAGEGNELTDALLRRNAAGEVIIPGTSLAGALRGLLTRLAPRLGEGGICQSLKNNAAGGPCGCAVCRLMGDVNPADEEREPRASASRLIVFDARPVSNMPALVRDSVGINRATGAAARAGAAKFDLEVLPAGSVFALRMELRDTGEEDEQLLAAGLAEWRAGRGWLGGNAARGLGAFRLEDLQMLAVDLSNRDSLLSFLKKDDPLEMAMEEKDWLERHLKKLHITIPPKTEKIPFARSWFRFEGILRAEGPLLTGDVTSSGATGFDRAPLVSSLNCWHKPVLSGAGLRGVLRSHAERIARTLATLRAGNGDCFLSECPACDPVENRKEKALASCDVLLKGRIRSTQEVCNETLCLACRLFGSSRRGSRLIVEDAPFCGDGLVYKMLDFLAVDRFTGGGAEGLKFDSLVLWKPAFKLQIYLDNPEDWELGWLVLVLRDLACGMLSVGYGAARGLGRVRLADYSATIGYLGEEDLKKLHLKPSGQQKGSIYKEMQVDLDDLDTMQLWVDRFNGMRVERGEKPKLPVIIKDSYFGCVDGLYEKEVNL